MRLSESLPKTITIESNAGSDFISHKSLKENKYSVSKDQKFLTRCNYQHLLNNYKSNKYLFSFLIGKNQ